MNKIRIRFGYGTRIFLTLAITSFFFQPFRGAENAKAAVPLGVQNFQEVEASASKPTYYTKLSNFAFFSDEIRNAAITFEASFPPNTAIVRASFAGVFDIPMHDDGVGGDQIAGDHIWTVILGFGDYIPRFYLHDGALDIVLGTTTGFDSNGATIGYNYFEVAILKREKAVESRALAPDVFITDYTANIVLPLGQFDPNTTRDYMRAASQRFYQYYPDSFDFIAIFSAERPVYNETNSGTYTQAPTSYGVSNDIQGINRGIWNAAAFYGSKGRLSQIINMNQRTSGEPLMHEIGHRWGILLNLPALDLTHNRSDGAHWGTSTVKGKMSYGLYLNNNGDGTYTAGNLPGACGGCSANIPFDDLELYLMGLLPASAVSPRNFVIDPAFRVEYHMVIPADKTEVVTIDRIQQVYGQRDPDERVSQKEFRIALLLVTTRPASAAEMSLLDETARYTASTSNGYPDTFWRATKGLGVLRTELNPERIPEIVRAAVSGKKLFVYGGNFDDGAKVFLNGERQKTANDYQVPGAVLIAKKAGKSIAAGQTVTLQVQNVDGKLSPEFTYSRP